MRRPPPQLLAQYPATPLCQPKSRAGPDPNPRIPSYYISEGKFSVFHCMVAWIPEEKA